ncbi:MAG: hypothetical protein ACE37B_07940 [Ilumatobacter sp.]|uniref:hypothetical protein n=1 Tax=Ilumatobacter sp. TaxID=1967498 RepID=UPI00391C38DE
MRLPNDVIEDLNSVQLAGLAMTMVELIAPYGVIASDVVEPALFRSLSERIVSAGAARDATEIERVCGDIIEQLVDDEPDGAGFYAFGAVVSVYYACSAIRAVPDGGLNAAKRFCDLTGAADDDGVGGLFDLAVDFLARRRDDVRDEIAARIAEHALALSNAELPICAPLRPWRGDQSVSRSARMTGRSWASERRRTTSA